MTEPTSGGSGQSHMVVGAIDFGTTYSGYAYSFRSDFRKDPLTISTTNWVNEGDGTHKVPTTILFDDKQNFHSFGYAAEKKYADLASADDEDDDDDDDDDDKHKPPEADWKNWFYFRRFKMALFREVSEFSRDTRQKIREEMKLTAANGKRMPAIKVFSEAIRYLKEHLDQTLAKSLEVKETGGTAGQRSSWADDIRWVLTVPAIWSNEAKQFMRMAAEKAGIAKDKLILALEPEAAAMLCKQLKLSKDQEGSEVTTFQLGKKFMVVDCGGGTVDVTAHKVVTGGGLEELHHATGDAIGGTNVDRKFFNVMDEWLGEDVMKTFRTDHASDWLEFEKNFESKKRSIGRSDGDTITFSNLGELCRIYKDRTGKSVSARATELNLQGKVKVMKENKFRFDAAYLRQLVFDGPIGDLINHLERLFVKSALSDIETVLLVGGFSECPILEQKVRDSFPNRNIINPPEANLAVMKGAVIFGHNPKIVTQRLSPRYYGIAVNLPFEVGKHPESHRMRCGDEDVCTDVFNCMIKKNAPLTRIQKSFRASSIHSLSVNIEIYESDAPVTYCTDSGCRLLGRVLMDSHVLDEQWHFSHQKAEIDISLEFGSTELFVVAQDKITKKVVNAKFDCLKR